MKVKEINEIRAQVAEVYESFIADREEQQARDNAEINRLVAEVTNAQGLQTPPKTMTEEEWHRLHGRRADGSKPRGPKPKPKKKVWEIEPGTNGTANEPAEPVDIDAIERQMEGEMFDRYIEEQKQEQKFLKGKRFREDMPMPRRNTDTSRLYH